MSFCLSVCLSAPPPLCLCVCLPIPPLLSLSLVANSCVSIQGKHCGKLRNGIQILCLNQGSEHGFIEWRYRGTFEISLEQRLLLALEGSGGCRRLVSCKGESYSSSQQGPANLSPHWEGAFCLGVSQPYLPSGITVWNYVMS